LQIYGASIYYGFSMWDKPAANKITIQCILSALIVLTNVSAQRLVPSIIPSPQEIEVNIPVSSGSVLATISGDWMYPSFMAAVEIDYALKWWVVLQTQIEWNINKSHTPQLNFEPAFTFWADTCKGRVLGGSVNVSIPLSKSGAWNIRPLIGGAYGFTNKIFLVSEIGLELHDTFSDTKNEFSVASGPYWQESRLYAGFPIRYIHGEDKNEFRGGTEIGFDITSKVSTVFLVSSSLSFDIKQMNVYANVEIGL